MNVLKNAKLVRMTVKLLKSRIEAAKDKGQFMKKVEVKMCSFLRIIKTPMDLIRQGTKVIDRALGLHPLTQPS